MVDTTHGPGAGTAGEHSEDPRRPFGTGLMVAGIVAVLLLGVLAAVALLRSDGDVELVDGFEGPAGLLEEESEVPWLVRSGEFERRDGAAQLRTWSGVPGFAVVDAGQTSGDLIVRFLSASDGSGLTFRYVDEDNHWLVVYVDGYTTWNIVKVEGGEAVFVANTGPYSVSRGTELVVQLRGDLIDIFVDGERRAVVTDNTHAGATRVGLYVSAAETDSTPEATRFESFEFVPG